MIRILINGICGQMGHAIYNAAAESDEFSIAAGVDCAPGAGLIAPFTRVLRMFGRRSTSSSTFLSPLHLKTNYSMFVRARSLSLSAPPA